MSLTMARSSPTSALRRVDLPALVSPIMATGTPFLMALPVLNESASLLMRCSIRAASDCSSERSANSSSSWSLKSSSSSMSEVRWSSWLRRFASSRLNPPRIWFMARRWVASEVEAIRSATASAWLRSILPFRKARWVYSPGPAARQPWSMSSCITFWRI